MQKLKLKSIYMLCGKCSSSHKEHNKIEFAFFGFFYDFIWILQDPVKAHKRGEIHFAIKPLESVECLQLCPWFTITPLERNQSEQCSPGARGRRGRPDSGDLAGGLGRGSSWGGSSSCGEPTWVLTHGGEVTGGRVWRRPAAAAAGSSAPASLQLGVANKWAGELCRCTREAGAARVCSEKRSEVEFTVSTDGWQ
jgi:hypothetical protein